MKVQLVGTGAIYTKYNSACTLINQELIVDMPFFLKHVYNYIKINNEIAIIGPKGIEDKLIELFTNNIVGCTGDSWICNGVEKLIENSKVTIADTSLREGDHCHMGIDNIKYLAKKIW